MQQNFLNKQIGGVSIATFLLFVFITLIGYWPVSSNMFSLKNDAYIYFLPCRYFISESIQNGHLPLWNPYFYMGFPLHGDMQGGVWNPIVILISLFTRYNMTVLQFETLLYILLAGIGMYKLLSAFNISRLTKITSAACYMFCGFIIDTGQITVWTASAAFLPFVFLYYHRLLYHHSIYINGLKTSLALYFLLSAGYPAFFIMCCYIMLAALLSDCIYKSRRHLLNKEVVHNLVKAHLLLVITFLLIALPALLSYIDYLPYYRRSSGTSFSEAVQNSFDPFAVISYIFPLSVTRDHPFITTDPTARSAFAGLFILVMLAGIFRKKITGLQKFIITVTFLFFLFSLGRVLPVRQFFYNYVPFTNLFRHPANMRLFTTIGLVILSAFSMDDLITLVKKNKAGFYRAITMGFISLICIALIVFFESSHLYKKVALFSNSFLSAPDKRGFIKDFYDSLTFADAIFLEGTIQMVFLLAFLLLLRKGKKINIKWMAVLFVSNAMFLAQLSIPDTFVTQRSPYKINSFIKESPSGYPLPDLETSIAENTAREEATNREYGCAAFYSKNLVQVQEELNPSFTNSLRDFDLAPAVNKTVLQYPVCYFADTVVHLRDSSKKLPTHKKILFVADSSQATGSSNLPGNKNEIVIKQFAPWGLFFKTSTSEPGLFVLFQNYNINWKLFIDGKKSLIQKGNISFMYAEIGKGTHSIQFLYRPPYLAYSIIISLSTLIIMCIIILIKTGISNLKFPFLSSPGK